MPKTLKSNRKTTSTFDETEIMNFKDKNKQKIKKAEYKKVIYKQKRKTGAKKKTHEENQFNHFSGDCKEVTWRRRQWQQCVL